MAQQCQGRCGEVQAIATAATGLACFIFRVLRRPLVNNRSIGVFDRRQITFTAQGTVYEMAYRPIGSDQSASECLGIFSHAPMLPA